MNTPFELDEAQNRLVKVRNQIQSLRSLDLLDESEKIPLDAAVNGLNKSINRIEHRRQLSEIDFEGKSDTIDEAMGKIMSVHNALKKIDDDNLDLSDVCNGLLDARDSLHEQRAVLNDLAEEFD